MEHKIKSICCIGAGYVGGPTMAVIADRCPNIEVTVVDLNKERIDLWNHSDLSKLPVYEPGLDQVISRCRGRNLHFTSLVEESIANADMVFLSVNTPTKKTGLGAGQASDLKWIEASARQVALFATGKTIVVEKSTLPVRTAETVKKILESAQKNMRQKNQSNSFSVLSNPEFLAEGTAISDLENPDRVLIGGDDEEAIDSLSEIYANWIDPKKILRTNLWSAELSKLTANAFLAQRISSINSISALCEATGANINEVALAVGMDSRLGASFLRAGPGFGGSCFKKDILNLVYLCKHYGLNQVSEYWEQVIHLNNWQQHRISRIIVERLFGTISGKKLAVLGFSFKANTNDYRESPSIQICKDLLDEGAKLAIYDPKVEWSQIKNCLDLNEKLGLNKNNNITGSFESSSSVLNSVKGADALIVLTEWDEFKYLNWEDISSQMRSPSWLFDSRNITNVEEAKSFGLNVWQLGVEDEI